MDHPLYQIDNNPIALIRAQHHLECPWIAEKIRRHIGYHAEVLDLGCGVGFLPNDLARKGHRVTGIDLSEDYLKIATSCDETGKVKYILGDVYRTPFSQNSFDVITAVDLLEHLSDHAVLLNEVSRVLRPGGLFIYNTLNRHPMAWAVGVKGIELFVRNTPKGYRAYSFLIRPEDLNDWLYESGLVPLQSVGIRPVIFQRALWKLLRTGIVPSDFHYRFSKSQSVGYIGCAQKIRVS